MISGLPKNFPEKTKGVVFSSGRESTEAHHDLARRVGKILAENGIKVINGGGPGLMEEVSRGAAEAGGEPYGVCFAHESRKPCQYLAAYEVHDDLRPRQERMMELADVLIVLPGGIGTLYEVMEVLARKFLKQMTADVYLVDKEFWAPFIEMLKKIKDSNLGEAEVFLVDTPDELIKMIKREE